jgi:hypothetical protein
VLDVVNVVSQQFISDLESYALFDLKPYIEASVFRKYEKYTHHVSFECLLACLKVVLCRVCVGASSTNVI